jgi:hypothetical protein
MMMKTSPILGRLFYLPGVVFMQFLPTAEIKIDMTKPLDEVKQVILAVSLGQPDQFQFFKDLDLWMGETIAKIEEGQKKVATENKDSPTKV